MLKNTRKKQQKVCKFIEKLAPDLFSHHFYLSGMAIPAQFNFFALIILTTTLTLMTLNSVLLDSLTVIAIVDFFLVILSLTGLLVLLVKRRDAIRLAHKEPYKLMNYLEKKSKISSIFLDIISCDAFLKQQYREIQHQQIHPTNYYEFLQSLTDKFYEIQAREKELVEVQMELTQEIKSELKNAEQRISLKVTQEHINALIEKNRFKEGFFRFHRPKMPYSVAHKKAYEKSQKTIL